MVAAADAATDNFDNYKTAPSGLKWLDTQEGSGPPPVKGANIRCSILVASLHANTKQSCRLFCTLWFPHVALAETQSAETNAFFHNPLHPLRRSLGYFVDKLLF